MKLAQILGIFAVCLTDKEAIQMLLCFAQIQHDKSVPVNLRSEFETKFLGLLYQLISSVTPFVSFDILPPPTWQIMKHFALKSAILTAEAKMGETVYLEIRDP